jgi:hypothetical protein
MIRFCAAAGALALMLAMALPVAADGVGPGSYDYLNPPADLKAFNTAPTPGSGTINLLPTGSDSGLVGTQDGQAALQLSPGSVPPSPGQTGVKIEITPVGKYPKPPKSLGGFNKLGIQGNVYDFKATYIPSGKPITHLAKPALMTLIFPNTPDVLLGTFGKSWFPLCSLKHLDRSASSLSCNVRVVPNKVIMLRSANTPLPSQVNAANLLIFIFGVSSIFIALIVMAWVAYRNFIRKKQPPSSSGPPPSSSPPPPPPPMNRAERRRQR